MQKFLILALCVAVAVALPTTKDNKGLSVSVASLSQAGTQGVVAVTRCGGLGTFLQLRVSGCEGNTCFLNPGTTYQLEKDFIPAAASTFLRLRIDVVIGGFPAPIVDSQLENSSVQQGVAYTIRFQITPNDILRGQTVTVRANIYDDKDRVESCVEVPVAIV